MKIGIIYAMEREGQLLINSLRDRIDRVYDGIEFHKGFIGKNEVIVSKSGVGKVNSAIHTTYMKVMYFPDLIINTGIAGGSSALKTRDIIIADKLFYSDVDATMFGYPYGTIPKMPDYYETDREALEVFKKTLRKLGNEYKVCDIYSSDSFIDKSEKIPNAKSEEYACDMEATAVAQACYKLSIPFIALRFISDILDSPNHLEDYNAFENEMSVLSATQTINVIKNL